MTTSDAFIANPSIKVDAARAAQAASKTGDRPRSAADDQRFADELRAARADDAREAKAARTDAAQARAADDRAADDRAAADRAAEERAAEDRAAEDRARADAREDDQSGRDANDDTADDNTAETAADASSSSEAAAAEGATADTAPVFDIIAGDDAAQANQPAADQVQAAANGLPGTPAQAAEAQAGTQAAAATAGGTEGQQTGATAAVPTSNAGTPAKAAATAAQQTAAAAGTAQAATPADEAASQLTATQAAQTGKSDAARADAALRDAAAAPQDTDVAADTGLAAKAAASGQKRGLGFAAAESLSENRSEARPSGDTARPAMPEQATATDRAQQPGTTPAAAQRSAASEIAMQAAFTRPATPAAGLEGQAAGADAASGSLTQSADGTAPQPSTTIRAIVTATAQPGTPAQPQTPARDIAVTMQRNLANGTNRFEIRLDPAELGRIDVRMELGADGRVQAHLTVEKPETLEMLQRDAKSLEKALADAGLDMEQGSLGYSLRDDGSQRDFASGRGDADALSRPQGDEELAADLAAVQHVYALKAGSGTGVDIRI